MLWGLFRHKELTYFFSTLDQANPEVWAKLHPTETTMLFGSYVVLTFIVGYLFGLLCGVWRLNHPVTSFLLKNANWLQRLGVTRSLGERPIIYQVLSPEISPEGVPSIVFVEVEMKGNLGFYSGQVRQYAVVKDGEPHKLIYIVEVWFKLARADEYVAVEAEGIMIDLADVATMKVDQVSASILVSDEEVSDSNSVPEDIDGGVTD